MKLNILTVMPDFFRGGFEFGIVGRAIKNALVSVQIIDLRDFTEDIHRTVDDRPYGGGAGMVLKPEPIGKALDRIPAECGTQSGSILLFSAQGRVFRQKDAERWSALDSVTMICGRYEGVDERVALHMVDEEVSIGDFVLSGGEPAAMVIADAIIRLLPGALGNVESVVTDSFSSGILGYPQYTRPPVYRGWEIPEVLTSGDHQKIKAWREAKAIEKTRNIRPELLSGRQ